MTKKEKAAIKRYAADVRESLAKHQNIGISALNYGLGNSSAVVDALSTLLPDVTITKGGGFLGYLHFERRK